MTEQQAGMSRGLFAAVVVSIIVEGAMYSALVPLLAQLVEQFHMSNTVAGLLMSGYSGGLVAGSLGSIPLLHRMSARAGVVTGLIAMAATTILLATTTVSDVLVLSRIGQGVSAGLLWTACVVWLLNTSSPARRGTVLGRALSYSFIGTIAGPSLGTLATVIGRQGACLAVALFCLVVAAWVATTPAPPPVETYEQPPAAPAPSVRPIAMLGFWVVIFAGLCAGVINVIAPLRLSALGATDFEIGLVFVVASVATVVIGTVTGTLVDRIGAAAPALVTCIALIALFASTQALHTTVLYAGSVLLAIVVLFACFVAGQTMLTRSGEAVGWSLRFCTAASVMAWGLGETVGAAVAGTGLDRFGPGAAAWGAAGAAALTLAATAAMALTRQGEGFQRGVPREESAPR